MTTQPPAMTGQEREARAEQILLDTERDAGPYVISWKRAVVAMLAFSDAERATTEAATRPDSGDSALEQARTLHAALERQMETQDEHLPSSMARRQGLVWLEGWFDLSAALTTTTDNTGDPA